MFKLVKSNSCNSRLELAGAEYPEDTEIVRRIVHQFETHKFVTNENTTTTNDGQLLVRSKLIVNSVVERECGHLPQPAVNSELNAVHENEKNLNKIQKQTEHKRKQLTTTTTTIHQAEAKDIRTENNGSDMDTTIKNAAGGAVAAKVCRNRNVDLAFILAKQQSKSAPVSNEIDNSNIAVSNRKVATVTEALVHNNNEISVKKIVASMHELSSERANIANNSAVEVSQAKQSTKCYTSSPGQILVPVEIHRADDEEPHSRLLRIENTSSVVTHFQPHQPLATAAMTTSAIDDTVVKYYVANDKSIYEKRRYNDIEFEEFEVYDPTKKKDFDKRIVEEKSAINQTVTDDVTNVINAKEPENPQSTVANNNNCISSDDKSHQEGYRSAETDTDCCYDSLDGKV